MERGTVKVTCLAQERNAVPQPGLESESPDPESSPITIRPPHLPSSHPGGVAIPLHSTEPQLIAGNYGLFGPKRLYFIG